MAGIAVGDGGAGSPGVPPDLDVRLYTKAGLRKFLPQFWIDQISFELLERGGMGSGSFSVRVPWNEANLDGTEYFDVRLFGVLIYRGFVKVASREISDSETASPSLQSLVETFNHYPVQWMYAYGGGADISVVAADLIADFAAITNRWAPRLAQDLQVIGHTVTEFDARGRSFAQAMNMLCDLAPNKAIWGVEAPTVLLDRIYLRPKPTTWTKQLTIGGLGSRGEVTGFVLPKDVGAVINVIMLTGGPVQQPNLCYNASFEEVAPASEVVANLLSDYSFEDNDPAWVLTGSRKFTGQDGTAVGVAKSGKYWLELDNNTEKGEQTVTAPYTVQYTGIAWIRKETAGATAQAKLTLEGLNAANAVVITAATAFITPAGTQWEKITVDLDPTAQPTVTKVRFRVETNGGSASNDGVLIDDCALIEKNGEGSVGWRRRFVGAASAASFQWNFRLPDTLHFHRGYAVKCQPSGIAGAGDYVEIRTTKDRRISVPPNERLSLLIHTRKDSANIDYSFGITEFTADGTETTTSESATETNSLSGWVQSAPLEKVSGGHGQGVLLRSDTASVEVFIRFRDNDLAYVDGVFLCVGEIPFNIRTPAGVINGDYWPGENYERRLKTSDSAFFTGEDALDAAAASSITTYGEREEEVSNEFVTDMDTARAFARPYLNVSAVPAVTARVEATQLTESAQLLTCADGRVKVLNLDGAPDPLNPARVAYTITADDIRFSADLGTELPTIEKLLRIVQGREKGRTF